ncbi:MAG: hypothetical protein KAI53_05430 [Candidatus Aenigmarchaeota archaeon]|nr:hypothetical protein [Candidatus Aenigmarchaeota archaeon]
MVYVGPGRNSKVWLGALLKKIHETNGAKSTVAELEIPDINKYPDGGHISNTGYAVSAVPALPEMRRGIDFSIDGLQVYPFGSKVALITKYTGSNPFGSSKIIDLDRLVYHGDKRRTKDNGLREKGETAKEIAGLIDTHSKQNEVPFVGDVAYKEALSSCDNTLVFLVNA